MSEVDRQYYATHREQEQARRRVYRDSHREAVQAADRAYDEARRERKRAYDREHDRVRAAAKREYRRRRRAAEPWCEKEWDQRKRARKQLAFVATVNPVEVYERCRGRCHICGGAVSRRRRYPDPLSASIDHLVPLARGGRHEPANVSLAHLRCNLQRGVGRLPAQLWLLSA